MFVEMVEAAMKTAEPLRPPGVLQQNRVFLDFFWDLAKPDQEVRLKAVEDLVEYLKTGNKVRRNVITDIVLDMLLLDSFINIVWI